MTFYCEHCGERFDRRLSGARPVRFCGQPCYHAWRQANDVTTGQFQAGQTPWNRGVRGLHLSPETEFKTGRHSDRLVPLGTVTTRRTKGGRSRQYIKTKSGWVEYAKALWIATYGCLHSGDVVHHINGERLDDRIENLIALPRTDHPAYHSRWGLKPVPADMLAQYRSRYVGGTPMLVDPVLVESPTQIDLFEVPA